MRIVGGIHRGRRLEAPPGLDVRPTSDRAREAVFNILAHGGHGAGGASALQGAIVLDAFCGTGALGLEALSRGAARAIFIDNDPAALVAVRANVAAMKEQERVRVMAADATRPPPRAKDLPPATLAFLDPPYATVDALAALAAFADADWLAPKALAVVEISSRAADPAAPDGFDLLASRRYGAARVLLLRRIP